MACSVEEQLQCIVYALMKANGGELRRIHPKVLKYSRNQFGSFINQVKAYSGPIAWRSNHAVRVDALVTAESIDPACNLI